MVKIRSRVKVVRIHQGHVIRFTKKYWVGRPRCTRLFYVGMFILSRAFEVWPFWVWSAVMIAYAVIMYYSNLAYPKEENHNAEVA